MRLWLFLISCLLAFIAGHMVNYSIIFLALEWFNSHTLAGLGFGLCFGPPIVLGWFAGVYCDRYSPRKVLLVAQNSFFISLLLLYIAQYTTPDHQKILLLSAALFSGVAWSFVAPARFATLPFYIKQHKLTTATITLNLMVMMGFGLAPMLVKQIKAAYDWQSVILTATILFTLSSLLLIPLKFNVINKNSNKSFADTFAEIKSSFIIVKHSPFIWQFLLLAIIAYLLMGPMQVILPTIAQENLQLNESAQGSFLSLVAFSLITGGLFAMWSRNKGKLGLQLLLSIIIAGTGIATLGKIIVLKQAIIVLISAATCGGIAISIIVAGLQRFSPTQHRGRIMSFYTIISQFIPAAAGIASGVLAQAFDPSTAMMIIGSTIVVAIIIFAVFIPAVRNLSCLETANVKEITHAQTTQK